LKSSRDAHTRRPLQRISRGRDAVTSEVAAHGPPQRNRTPRPRVCTSRTHRREQPTGGVSSLRSASVVPGDSPPRACGLAGRDRRTVAGR
jgi:hypothetical protein